MAAPQSTPLPEAPTRGEAEGQFVPKANAFVGALELFRQQLQAQADFVNDRSIEAEENAALAQEASEMALSSANFAGDWSGLSGAFNVPTSVLHDDTYWQLLEDVPNIQDAEPGVSEAWAPINVARSVVLALPDITALRALGNTTVGQRISTAGTNDANDGGACDYIIEERDGTRDWFMNVHLNDGVHQARLVRGVALENLTVLIPTDYPNKQAAIDDTYTKILMWPGAIIDLMMEGGYEISAELRVSSGDYSHYRVSSVDAVVPTAAGYADEYLMRSEYAAAPVWNVMVDCGGAASRGLWYSSSTGMILPGNGLSNNLERALYLNNSTVYADGMVLEDVGVGGLTFSRAVWLTRESRLVAENAQISTPTTDSAVYISRDSRMHAAQISIDAPSCTALVLCQRNSKYNGQDGAYSGSTGSAFFSRLGGGIVINGSTVSEIAGDGLVSRGAGSYINADGATLSPASGGGGAAISSRLNANISGEGIVVEPGFNIGAMSTRMGRNDLNLCTITGCTSHGTEATFGGANLVTGGEVSGSGGNDIRITGGSTAWAHGTTTTNGTGSPFTSDTNLSEFSFNEVAGNRGIIWA